MVIAGARQAERPIRNSAGSITIWANITRTHKQESEELNMAARAERLKISTTEENRAIKALQEAAYIKGYMTAELRSGKGERERENARKEKRYFLTQKLYGVAMLILTAVSVKLLEGDITAAFILVPMGIVLITSKEMLIVNKYFWECEGKEWYL